MYRFLCVVLLFTVAVASDVLEFTDSNFDDEIKKHDIILVEFFAPWCGHCKKLAPEYEKAATRLKTNDPPVPLAKVDCTANSGVCGKHGVSGYPTLKIFRSGEFHEDYNGAREAGGIVKTMQGKAGPTSKPITTVEEAEKFLKNPEYGVLGFFESADSELAKTFQKVADAMSSELRFGHSSEAEVLEKYGHKDAIVLYQPKRFHSKFEEKEYKYTEDATVYKIKTWLQGKMLGLCALRTMDNAEKFKRPLFVVYYNVDYTKNEKGTNYWRNRVMKVGKKLLDEEKKAYFAISNNKDFSYELNECGFSDPEGDKPVVCARDGRDLKYQMTADFSMDTFETFVRDLLDGKLEPYLKSEPIPDNTEPLKVAVAKNFEELVNNPDKDVLIEFYAPWCGHCKSLAPKYEELAEKMKDEPEITIAKMDATANDVTKPYEVSGFPTLYFAPKGKKSAPVRYEGGREVDDFIKYLAREATNELQGWDRSGKKKKEKSEL